MTIHQVATGAHLRVRGPADGVVVLTINGGTARDVPGTWSATTEYLVDRLAARHPQLGWGEVRYRVRSWKRHEMCIADGRAALDRIAAGGAREVILVGFSLGGAVSTQIADHPLVQRVIGLAPWLPKELPVDALAGREFHVIHGALDRRIPGVPGVHPDASRAGFERIRAAGATGTYRLIPLGTHAIALRAPWGAPIPVPRAAEWVRQVGDLIAAPSR